MQNALIPLAEQVQQRLQACDRAGRTLTLKVKYASFRQITRCCTQAQGFQSAAAIGGQGRKLLAGHVEPRVGVRLLGLSVSNLLASAAEVKAESHVSPPHTCSCV
ncbi:MAG: hypothetical protein ACPGVO_19355 [Spirulinaceae cyanobacterium]